MLLEALGMRLGRALSDLIAHPVDLMVRRWNWKAALTSSIVRATIFFFANLGSGWRAAVGAMGAEYLYRAITSGFYGAITSTSVRSSPSGKERWPR
jgi:hypothetical protein